MQLPTPSAVHQPERQRFIVTVDGGVSVLDYRLVGTAVHILHTEVPPALQGRGLAAALVQAALAHARSQGWRVRPVCSYVQAYMQRHPETIDLLESR